MTFDEVGAPARLSGGPSPATNIPVVHTLLRPYQFDYMFLGFSGSKFPRMKKKKMKLKCAVGKFCRTSRTTNHINDIHLVLFLMIFTFFFFFFFACPPGPFFSQPSPRNIYIIKLVWPYGNTVNF